MELQRLIRSLEALDPAQPVPLGFARPHSYRGYYEQLAFEPEANTTVGAMLTAAKGALGATYEGYKGGEYLMTASTTCWVSNEGDNSGDMLGPMLLGFMLGRHSFVQGAPWQA